eukprot:TRINITY_DN14830_c0_g1_i1.p1 TRINITY_DN14830_c0_g1~~TRINITY_DN14830_c0_g1_i1.p1  ORF type:complete len:260 (-),score=35.13 TRINITY_DN14830_c0_g1_i1:127-906(-)
MSLPGHVGMAPGPGNSRFAPLRKWATDIAVDMINRVFAEFDHETALAFDELSQMRGELGRVAELLEVQLQRERQIHDLMDSLAHNHGVLANHTMNGLMSSKHPSLEQLHHILDEVVGHNDAVVQDTLSKVLQVQAHADAHGSHASNLRGQSITTEHELSRVKQLLSMPVPGAKLPATLPQVRPVGPPVPTAGLVVPPAMPTMPMRMSPHVPAVGATYGGPPVVLTAAQPQLMMTAPAGYVAQVSSPMASRAASPGRVTY